MKIIKQFENPLFTIYLKESNVLVVETPQEIVYDVDEVKQIIDNVRYIAKNKRYLILVKPGPLSTISFDALRVLSHPEALEYAYAKAYVIQTISQRLMANFFLHYFKPKLPIKFFTNPKEAELWLLKNYRHLYR